MNFFLKKFEKVEKTGIISTKFSLRCTPSVILGLQPILQLQPTAPVGVLCFQLLIRPWLRSFFPSFSVFLSKTKTKWSTYQSDIRVDMVGTIHDDLHTMTVYTIGSIPHKYFFDTIMAIAQNIMKYFFWVSFFWKLT